MPYAATGCGSEAYWFYRRLIFKASSRNLFFFFRGNRWKAQFTSRTGHMWYKQNHPRPHCWRNASKVGWEVNFLHALFVKKILQTSTNYFLKTAFKSGWTMKQYFDCETPKLRISFFVSQSHRSLFIFLKEKKSKIFLEVITEFSSQREEKSKRF